MVMATGSSYNSSLKSTDISALYRLTGLEEAYAEVLTAKSILIIGKPHHYNRSQTILIIAFTSLWFIGGGLVGCELAR